jgi:hypothetical protein
MASTAVARAMPSSEAARENTAVHASARIGLVARGVLYAVVGMLALRLAFRQAHETADKNGALLAVARQPFGKALLVILAIGFACYCAWMVVRVFTIREDSAGKAWGKRTSAIFRAAVYGVLTWSAVDLVRRAGANASKGGNRQQQEWTARVLDWPAGRFIVAGVGAALLGAAGYFVYRAVTQKWRKKLDLASASEKTRSAVTVTAWAGWLGRGVVAALIGVFLVQAAWQFDAKKAVGVDGALRRVTEAAWGPFLLSVVAIGLFAFGVYSMIEARYRRVDES